jgi:hypothetical protein
LPFPSLSELHDTIKIVSEIKLNNFNDFIVEMFYWFIATSVPFENVIIVRGNPSNNLKITSTLKTFILFL